MMYWARRSRSSRSSGSTRRLRWTLNPECTQPRSMFARAGGRRPLSTRNVMTRARNSSSSGLRLDIGQDVEQARAHEQPVGDQGVQVGVEVEVLAEGVDGHDDAGQALGQVERGAQIFEQALVGEAAQVLEQVAVEAEVRAQHLGDAEGEMAVRDGEQDRLGQQRAEELDLLLVAGGAEPAPLAGERQQVLVLAVIAADAGEPALEVAAVEELVDDLRDDGAQEAVAGLVALLVDVQERGRNAADRHCQSGDCLGPARTIDLLHHAAQCRKEGVSSNGIPLKKV